jgi:hypothetical protein
MRARLLGLRIGSRLGVAGGSGGRLVGEVDDVNYMFELLLAPLEDLGRGGEHWDWRAVWGETKGVFVFIRRRGWKERTG